MISPSWPLGGLGENHWCGFLSPPLSALAQAPLKWEKRQKLESSVGRGRLAQGRGMRPFYSRQSGLNSYSAPFPRQPQNGDLGAVSFLSPRPKLRGASRVGWRGAQSLDSGNAGIEHGPKSGIPDASSASSEMPPAGPRFPGWYSGVALPTSQAGVRD